MCARNRCRGGGFASDDRWARPSGPRRVAPRLEAGPVLSYLPTIMVARRRRREQLPNCAVSGAPSLGENMLPHRYAKQPAQGEEPMKKRKVWRKLIVSRFTIPLRRNFAVRGGGLL